MNYRNTKELEKLKELMQKHQMEEDKDNEALPYINPYVIENLCSELLAMLNDKYSAEVLKKYGFKDRMGHPLENCTDFLALIVENNHLHNQNEEARVQMEREADWLAHKLCEAANLLMPESLKMKCCVKTVEETREAAREAVEEACPTTTKAAKEWNALPRALEWTNKPPRVPGCYLGRKKNGNISMVIYCFYKKGELGFWNGKKFCTFEQDETEYFGPIPEPKGMK